MVIGLPGYSPAHFYNNKWIFEGLTKNQVPLGKNRFFCAKLSHEKTPALLSIEYWLSYRGPYSGLLQSPYNWVV